MKKISIGFLVFSFLWSSAFAAVDDNSIIEELTKDNVQELNEDFSLKTFGSCDAMENVLEDYIKTYWENNKNNRYPIMYSLQDDVMMESSVQSDSSAPASEKSSNVADGVGGGGEEEFSQTNTQVAGVDESDIIKTDGKYIYYYNQTQKAVYIIETATEKVLKKINLPETFWGPVMYIDTNKLVIIASGYSNTDYSKRGYYIDRNSKTYTIVFDTTSKSDPKLIKLYASDGNITDSRKIGDYLYVLSNNYFDFPYNNWKNIDDIDISFDDVIPKKLDVSRTDTTSDQNLTLAGKDLPYNVQSGNIADCNSIEYSFPDEETLKNTSFNPGYNIISTINLKDITTPVKTKVIAGSNSTVYMSLDNLYLTEGIYQPNNFACPPNARCAMPFFWGGTQNTLVHKLSVDKMDVQYQATGLVPGSPLNQYSMDEKDTNFRIITSTWQPEQSTGLYILDKDLKLVSSLENLAPGESFQSSRFMGDKLFLVTFEQIDPLFAIDLTDVKRPTVLGELKIPGFSTYLHPYDDTHIIGLGYDTQLNNWGGTTTAGLKVDLYKINYDKKCGDTGLTAEQVKKCASGDYKGIIVEQKFTDTFGGQGSYSEALNNPRMFVWNANKKTLLLPATLYDRDVDYKTTDFYNGLLSIQVDANLGIKEKGRISHVDTTGVEAQRIEECSQYTALKTEPVCKELVDGTLYCAPQEQQRYIPNYCYKDSTVWQYIGDNSWKFQDQMITRGLYIGDNIFAISDSQISGHNFTTLNETSLVEMK